MAAASAAPSATYVVCLDCGKEFAYDWKSMRVGGQVTHPAPVTDVQPIFR